MIWIAFFLLSAAAVMSVLWPLAMRRQLVSQPEAAVSFYKSQLATIDRDRDSGLMAPAEASAAKTEAARRLLGTGTKADLPALAGSALTMRTAAALAIVCIPAFAVALYGRLGRPDLPDVPLAARLAAPPEAMDIPALIAKLEAEVAARPNDGRGYELLAPIYLRLNRPGDAGKAYARALALLGDSARLRADYAETFVAEAGGKVTPLALAEFDAALKLDPALAKARFYKALSVEQAGNKAAALDMFKALVADAPPGAGYVPAISERIARLGGAAPVPSPAAEIAALPDAERAAAIRSMVEGLASRLAQNGQDEAGWLRLIRALSVLHEDARTKAALADARRAMASDPAALARIAALAKELALEAP